MGEGNIIVPYMQTKKRKENPQPSPDEKDTPIAPLDKKQLSTTAQICSTLNLTPSTPDKSDQSHKKPLTLAPGTFSLTLLNQIIEAGLLKDFTAETMSRYKDTPLYFLIKYMSRNNLKSSTETMSSLLKQYPDLVEIKDRKGRLPYEYAKARKLPQNIIDLLKEPWHEKFETQKNRAHELIARCKSFTNMYPKIPDGDRMNLQAGLQKNYSELEQLLDEMTKLKETIKIEDEKIVAEIDKYLTGDLYNFSQTHSFSLTPSTAPKA